MDVITQEEARKLGMAFFFTGRPCIRGEKAARRVNGGGCVCIKCTEHRRTLKAQQYKQDPDKFRKAARESARRVRAIDRDAYLSEKKRYREANREMILANQRARRVTNIDADRERKRLYRKERPEVNLASGARYRARKSVASPGWDREFDDFVMLESVRLCRQRYEATGIKWEVDHMIPIRSKVVCGLHVGLNLQVIPAWMNNSKNNRMIYTEPGDWLK
jgi:hypothetical protein